MLELRTEHLFDAHFIVDSAAKMMRVGDGGRGQRIVAPVIGGTVDGPRIKAVARNFGADWLLVRHDSVWDVDVRLVLETGDGALIHMAYPGIVDMAEDDAARLLRGEVLRQPARVHTTPRFETGHEGYRWLNELMAAAIGIIDVRDGRPELDYSVYALR